MRTTVALLLSCAALAGCSSGSRRDDPNAARGPRPTASDVADRRDVGIRRTTKDDVRDFEDSWRLFVMHDPLWPAARSRWLERGGAAPYMLSENLFRYFWSASKYQRRDEVLRVADSAAAVGEPAVAYFAKALVTDKWPLKEPVTVEIYDPENPTKPIRRTFDQFDVDDTTRQHAARVLATVGVPAIPTLSKVVLTSELRSARVYGAYALGSIGTDAAVAPLAQVLAQSADWQTRGAAAKALGFALRKNPSARPHLEKAVADPDSFVRKKAAEGLEGRTKLEF